MSGTVTIDTGSYYLVLGGMIFILLLAISMYRQIVKIEKKKEKKKKESYSREHEGWY